MKILVTGSSGFISGYLIENLLENNHKVIGLDNYSKYGKIEKSYDKNKSYSFIQGDAKDTKLLISLLNDCDQIVASAAKIGGIGYFHKYPYDLISENEKIIASTFDAAIYAFKNYKLKKINVISSSMVYENTKKFPTLEGEQLLSPPPSSTYGFQKLSCEYFAKGAYEQYKLPYTIIRPFNCIGIGENRAKESFNANAGNIKLALSHVVPDLIQKILKDQNPLHILGNGNQIRHYTYGADLAEGIRLCIENKNAINNEFNLSSKKSHTIIELAEIIWNKIQPNKKFSYICDEPYEYDVQFRSPSTLKALDLLGFQAKTRLEDALDIIIPWIKNQIKTGVI